MKMNRRAQTLRNKISETRVDFHSIPNRPCKATMSFTSYKTALLESKRRTKTRQTKDLRPVYMEVGDPR